MALNVPVHVALTLPCMTLHYLGTIGCLALPQSENPKTNGTVSKHHKVMYARKGFLKLSENLVISNSDTEQNGQKGAS